MAEEKVEKVFITVELNNKTGGFTVHSNATNQIMQLGMLAFATAQVSKPKESVIQKPGTLDLALHGKS